jgi:uncharacterized RDD family membrane protein YckC
VNFAALPSASAAAYGAVPGLARRLACLVYEGVLLFGVVMATGLAYAIATGQRHALVGSSGLQTLLFVVLGAYFVVFWSRGGQTLAMKTWHIRLVARNGLPPGRRLAFARYLLSWLWFLPALFALHASGLKGALPSAVAVLTGVLTYAALARLHPQRQYWHDAVCRTRLVMWEPGPAAGPPSDPARSKPT